MSGVSSFFREGFEIFYDRRGAGPRLLYFSGSGATIESSEPLLALLARNFEVICLDQRGLGRTGLPPSPHATMADYADDGAALLDHLGWNETAVLGISFGGMVAQEFAINFPARVSRLALLCTSPGGEGGSSFPLHTLLNMEVEERAEFSTTLWDRRFTPEYLAENAAAREVAAFSRDPDGAHKDERTLAGEALQLQARSLHDTWDRLDRITAPTFVGAGLYDGVAPVENSKALCSRIVRSDLALYEGGHLFLLQDRRAWGDLTRFLLAER